MHLRRLGAVAQFLRKRLGRLEYRIEGLDHLWISAVQQEAYSE